MRTCRWSSASGIRRCVGVGLCVALLAGCGSRRSDGSASGNVGSAFRLEASVCSYDRVEGLLDLTLVMSTPASGPSVGWRPGEEFAPNPVFSVTLEDGTVQEVVGYLNYAHGDESGFSLQLDDPPTALSVSGFQVVLPGSTVLSADSLAALGGRTTLGSSEVDVSAVSYGDRWVSLTLLIPDPPTTPDLTVLGVYDATLEFQDQTTLLDHGIDSRAAPDWIQQHVELWRADSQELPPVTPSGRVKLRLEGLAAWYRAEVAVTLPNGCR